MQMSSELIFEKVKLSSLVMLYKWKTHSGDLPVRRKLINRKSEGVLRNIENVIDMIECDFAVIFFFLLSEAELSIHTKRDITVQIEMSWESKVKGIQPTLRLLLSLSFLRGLIKGTFKVKEACKKVGKRWSAWSRGTVVPPETTEPLLQFLHSNAILQYTERTYGGKRINSDIWW